MLTNAIHIKFDPDQLHQTIAVDTVSSLFEGLDKIDTSFQLGDLGVPNIPEWQMLDEQWLEQNIRATIRGYNHRAEDNGLTKLDLSHKIFCDEGFMLDKVSNLSHRYPRFTIEMETGTGKTYVYLRTVHELRKGYGFRKFIIIVPSRAIYEGTAKSFEMTKEHFKALYDNEVINLTKYSSERISKLREYASSTFTEVLLMTIDAFNKVTNKIYKPTEKLPGEKLPYEYIQETRPILILDESQNYLTSRAKEALRTLKPLFALCYSATPVKKPNLIYRLTPVDAFKMNLVKRIEVLGVKESEETRAEQLDLFEVEQSTSGYGLYAEMRLNVIEGGRAVARTIRIHHGDDLFAKTNNEAYRGYVVSEINMHDRAVRFENGEELSLDSSDLSNLTKRDLFRVQIEETIRIHMQKQREMLLKGIKVLSLFFIDRVANYVEEQGLIRVLFDQAYERIKNDYPYFKGWSASEVREGYFAKKVTRDREEFVDTRIENKLKADREAEKAAYELIMKKKEQLLSFDEKVCFIFAHSALKEGWDNPNVFQICTLNQTVSERKKRQEIGRGLRIPVNNEGVRDFDETTNILTVIANESYEDYVSQLQSEYRETNDVAPPAPSNARKVPAKRNDKLFNGTEFKHFWSRLMRKTSYTIHVDSKRLIEDCMAKLKQTSIPEPQITITRGRFVITDYNVTLLEIRANMAHLRISREDTEGNTRVDELWYKKGEKLNKKAKDENLKGFMLVDLEEAGDDSIAHFGDAGSLRLGESKRFSTERGQDVVEKREHAQQTEQPIPNFIERAARETNLTKRTLAAILKGLGEDKLEKVKINPEGFSGLFVTTIKDILADHIADRVEYHLHDDVIDEDVEIYFPKSRKFPQKELIEGSDCSMYDQIQIDSDVEKRFVTNKLNEDDQIVCYFKFPSKFRIDLPKIIGDYNPDWGIIRKTENGLKLELVRETKGGIDINLLQYPHEKRKIVCAKKHFEALGIDYRVITGEERVWW